MARRNVGNYGRFQNRSTRRPKITGERVVQHIGGREQAAAGTFRVQAVIPMLAGETLRQMNLWGFGITDDEEQPDSIMSTEWGVIRLPWDWLGTQFAASTSGVEGVLSEHWRQGTQQYDPNPGGTSPRANELFGWQSAAKVLYQKYHFAYPMTTYRYQTDFGVGTEATVARAFHGFRFSATVKDIRALDEPSIVAVVVLRDPHTAQTDLGILDVDALAPENYEEVLTGADFDELDATEQKLHELLYAGDTYIEADTWKDTSIRTYVHLTARIGTPYPRRTS